MSNTTGSSVPSSTVNTVTSGGSAGNPSTPLQSSVPPGVQSGVQASTQVGATTPAASPSAPVVATKGFRTQLQQMLLGWQAAIPSDSVLTSVGGALAQASVVAQLQAFLAVYSTLDAQVTALKSTRAQESAQLVNAHQYLTQLKEALVAFFGSGSPMLAQFGLKPKQPAKKLTSAQAAVRVAKAKVTRGMRGTTSKLKKAPLKSGPMEVSVVSTANSATAPTPAAPAQSTAASPK